MAGTDLRSCFFVMYWEGLVMNDFTKIIVAGFAALVLIVSCQDPTTTISTTHERDTVLVVDTVQTIHVDTVLVFQVDSIYIWCWEVDHRRESAEYRCTNGYQGPLFP